MNRVLLDVEQMNAAWAARRADMVCMCMAEINKRLFSGRGVIAQRAGVADDSDDTFMSTYMVPFARDSEDAYMAFGVVPIAVGRVRGVGHGEQELVPFVPRYGTYNISTWAENGVQQFGFHWTADGAASPSRWGNLAVDPDAQVQVAHDFGKDPDLTGRLNSLFHSCVPAVNLANKMTGHLLDAERVASLPPVVTEYDASRAPAVDPVIKSSPYAGGAPEAECETHAVNTLTRTAEQQAVWKEQMRAHARSHGYTPGEMFRTRETSLVDAPEFANPAEAIDDRGYRMPWGTSLPLPPERHLVALQLPQARADYVPIQTMCLERVCAVLGVPRSLFTGSSAVSAGAENTASDMQRTVRHLADMLTTLMTLAYNVTQGTRTLERELRSTIERVRVSRKLAPIVSLISVEERKAMQRRAFVRLTFDLPPAVDLDKLAWLYGAKIISWRTFARYALRGAEMDASELATLDDPHKDDDRRSLAFQELKEDVAPGARPPGGKSKKRSKRS